MFKCPVGSQQRWYSVVVSINGCDPFVPGSNPGTAIFFVLFLLVFSGVENGSREAGVEPGRSRRPKNFHDDAGGTPTLLHVSAAASS